MEHWEKRKHKNRKIEGTRGSFLSFLSILPSFQCSNIPFFLISEDCPPTLSLPLEGGGQGRG
jgi:hypothetical protein